MGWSIKRKPLLSGLPVKKERFARPPLGGNAKVLPQGGYPIPPAELVVGPFGGELGKKFHIKEIAFDRWGAVQMVQNLEGLGFTVVPFGQGFKDMSPPTKRLMELVLEKNIAHGGHPVLRWMMDNIFVRTDPAGNIKPDKEKSTEKIDGAVATIMGLDRAIRNSGISTGSVYDERGILVF